MFSALFYSDQSRSLFWEVLFGSLFGETDLYYFAVCFKFVFDGRYFFANCKEITVLANYHTITIFSDLHRILKS